VTLVATLGTTSLEEREPLLYLFLKSLSMAVDRLNVNLSLSYDEANALQNQSASAGGVDNVVSVGSDVLVVKAIRFLKDRHGLTLASAESMGARLRQFAGQTIPNVTLTPIVFSTGISGVEFDIDGEHDVYVNNTRLTIRHAGRYVIGSTVWWDAFGSTAGYRELKLTLNGTTVVAYDVQPGAVVVGFPPYNHVVTIQDLVEGDYLEIQVFQNSGGNLDTAASYAATPQFWAHCIS